MNAISVIKARCIRVVARHQRGRDRSSQASSGKNKATSVAHSTDGEPAWYIGTPRDEAGCMDGAAFEKK